MYSLNRECTLRKMGREYLLMIYPEQTPACALNVNESFARIFTHFQVCETFSEKDIALFLEEEYGLEQDFALSEAAKTIALWKEYGILQ